MIFNSLTYIFFFIIVFLIYKKLTLRAQNYFLLIASYVFYAWWDFRFLFLVILITIIDFSSGLIISDGFISKKQRVHLSLILIGSAFLCIYAPALIPEEFSYLKGFMLSKKLSLSLLAFVFIAVLAGNLFYLYIINNHPQRKRKIFFLLSIISNLTILGFFKYFNFFSDTFNVFLSHLGIKRSLPTVNIILPVGISFFTFMTMTYIIDLYKNKIKPARKLSDYALFVSFFPKILAGPIERAAHFLPQITTKRTINKESIESAFHQILMGFFKKIVIADGVVQSVNSAFSGTYQLSWTDAVLGAFLFSVQIYCDFSGYSDIAIGSARLLGFNLTQNFNYPYFSQNPSQFWGRWHITLSSWLRDYVFFPLGGPYGSTIRWLRNIMITFFVTGLWHGASWTYVVWGLYHGVLLALHRLKESLIKKRRKSKRPIIKWVSIICFFFLTCIGWIIFRANSIDQAFMYIRTIFTINGNFRMNISLPSETALLGLLLFIAIEIYTYNKKRMRLDVLLPLPIWTAVYAGIIFLIVMSLSNVPAGFIYLTF